MQFKTDRIRDEWAKLAFKNPGLFDIVTRLHDRVKEHYKKELVLTCILRTKEENDALYAAVPLDKRPAASPHCFWYAVDVRSSTFNNDEIQSLVAWLNTTFKNPSGKATAVYHSIPGGAPHFHLQHVPLEVPGKGNVAA